MNPLQPQQENLYDRILSILDKGRNRALQTINENMLLTYWEIGKEIVESEQGGEDRAVYGDNTLNKLSIKLSTERGRGYSVDNLAKMRLLYIAFPKSETLSRKLTWSHYYELLKVKDPNQLAFYYNLLDEEYRDIRTLRSEIKSHLYQRQLAGTVIKTISSANQDNILVNLSGVTPQNQIIVSDPLVLDFLGLKEDEEYLESEMESRIIYNLERFMLELGKGFAFVARQKRISMDGRHFKIDLVLYNTYLKCFVLVDLKTGRLTHGDIGQMQMYVNIYDREIITEGDNKTLGIIIAQEKDDLVVKFTLPEDNQQIFTTRYQNIIPTELEIKASISNLAVEDNRISANGDIDDQTDDVNNNGLNNNVN
jgi:predicted nuclease of restriction endonuclease-like (RecB) superfamily